MSVFLVPHQFPCLRYAKYFYGALLIEGLICLICYIPPGSIQSIIQLDRQKDKRLIKILRERKVNMEQFTNNLKSTRDLKILTCTEIFRMG